MRFASALLAALVLAACAPVVVQLPDGPLTGPQLAIQVANASDREVAVGYEYDAVSSGGSGEGTVASCEQVSIPFGAISGQYRVLIDGAPVHEAAAPAAGVPADTWFVVRVTIGPDGETEVIGAGMTPRMPDPDPRPIAGCG